MRRISVVCVVLTFWWPSHVYIILSHTNIYPIYLIFFIYYILFDISFCTWIFHGFPPSPPRHAPPGSRSPSVPTVRLPLPTQPERHLPCVQCQPCQPSAWLGRCGEPICCLQPRDLLVFERSVNSQRLWNFFLLYIQKFLRCDFLIVAFGEDYDRWFVSSHNEMQWFHMINIIVLHVAMLVTAF